MKLRKLFAAFLAFVLLIDASPLGAIQAATEEDAQAEPLTVIAAPDTNYILRSAAVKYIEGSDFLERGDTTGLYEDDPRIDTLLDAAPGQFNDPGKEWVWMAYKLSVPADGTYTIGVTTNSAKNANFKLPMVVGGEVHTLAFTAKAQTVTAEVTLPAGEHVVTVFWPMPADESEVDPQGDWANYIWCNIASVTVDAQLTVSKPTATEVEASLAPVVKEDTVIPAVDTDRILLSATIQKNANALARTDQAAMKVDQPAIETLFTDALNQFNKTGEEWNWFAYKVSVPAEGTYTLGVKTAGSKYASYKLPLCVDGEVYALQYTEKAQLVTAEVALPAGEHTVVMFMPMPAAKADIAGNEWNDYHWCDVESVTVDAQLAVSKPTVAEAEAAVVSNKIVAATDSSTVLWSAAVVDKGNGYLEFDYRDAVKADKPYIESLLNDAAGEFNKAGEEWGWVAYKVTAPANGTYTLELQMQNCRNAPYDMPLYVNGEVYTLSYSATGRQSASVFVTLPAGEHTVVMFMPMPQNEAGSTGEDWVDYPWANPEEMTVDALLTVSKPTVAEVEACFPPAVKEDTVISAVDTDRILLSATIQKNANALGRTDQPTLKEDQPTISTLYYDAFGQFNASGSEWNWFAYKVNAPTDGTYTLGVKTAGSKYASYQLPVCVDGKVYALQYTEKSQLVTAEVTLPAGEHTVVMFMPMPATKSDIAGNEWNDYHWCDVESVTVDGLLTVSKPTVAEVEACFPPVVKEDTVISAVDTDRILLSATIQKNANALGRTDQPTLKEDQPTISTLYYDAFGQFNASGSEWNWFAYKVNAPTDGTYTLGVKTAGSKYASYQLPVCVDGKVYALQYTEKSQLVTAEVTLPAGYHTVVMFMPMPVTKSDIAGNEWNDYHWCDVESVTVDGLLTVSKPTVAEVEACFPDLVADSPLKGQSVLFVGDSITYSKNSWASKIGTWYNMDWTNSGVSGATISEQRERIIRHQLMINAGNDYDYVIMHGGINDADTQVGSVSDSWNVADFDTSTYAGALETMFYYAYENFSGAKLGYIVNYATPNSDSTKWKGTQDMSAYFAEGKKVCEKWGISYIDLYFGSTADGESYSYDILQVDKNAAHFLGNDPHEIHLSDQGYQVISPYIAQWMESLTEKASPIPAQSSGKYIDAIDGDKVLYGGFTAKSEYKDGAALAGLQDRVYTGMAEDQATIELLPYAKDMLGNWAFASIAVDVAQDGEYTFRVELAAKTAYQMGMLVDSEAYTLVYPKQDGYYQFIEQTVSLTKGTHYITFTAAMPNNDNELEGNAWDTYPWTNIASIVVDGGVQVLSKPALEDVTAKLQSYTPAYTRIEAENTEYVLYNNYNTPNESNAAASGGMVVGGAWTSTYRQTFEELESWLNSKGNAYVEYAIVAPADGEYDIRVAFLAGSNDKTVAKPYIAVIVNDTTYQVQFSKEWNQVDKVKLTVSLKEGLNIIRCTSMTTEQEIYGARGWINHDFLDMDTRLTPVKRSTVMVEAENSKYYNKLKVQEGGETEAASGKILGNSDRRYISALKLTLDKLTGNNLRQIPYFSITVTAPQNGYYPIRVAMAADGRLGRSTVGMIVDGKLQVVEYTRTDKTTKGAMVETLVYLTEGNHVLTFTTPIPATSDPNVNYGYYWADYDYVMLYDGLVLSKNQKAPTAEAEYVRIEVEDYAMFNLNKNNGAAAGNAYYKCAQSIAQILESGIDGGKTPYVELTVQANKAGSYVLYIGVNAGMTEGNTVDEADVQLAVEINGTVGTKWVRAVKSTNYTIIPLQVELKEGLNTIRLTHLSSDAHYGGTTWIDFDYIEMPYWETQQISFTKPGEKLEAETARYDGFGESLSGSYSGGRYLGRANYDTVAEVNITYDTMDPANLNGLPHVTYRVFAKEAGTYAVTVGFAAGLTNYTAEEIQQSVAASFVAIVNGETKQRVEFTLGSTSANMTRLIMLELKEGENEVTITGTTSEYVIDRVPRNDETYRLVWIDQDYLLLSGELSNLGQDVDPFNIEDSGYDFGQLVPRTPAPVGEQPDGNTAEQQPEIPVIVWILTGIGVLAILFIIILIGKKRKKNKE